MLYTTTCTPYLLSTPRLLSAVAIPLQAPWPPAIPQIHQIQFCLRVCPIYMDTFFASFKSLLKSYRIMRGTLPLESSPALHFFFFIMQHVLSSNMLHCSHIYYSSYVHYSLLSFCLPLPSPSLCLLFFSPRI